jgi:hypothetical protein
MSNLKAQISNQFQSPKHKGKDSFEFWHWTFIWHLKFVIWPAGAPQTPPCGRDKGAQYE